MVAPGRPRQAAVAGDVVGVVVGLEHVLDPHAVQAAQPQVGLDRPLRVDDRRDAGVGVADQVGGAAQVLVQDLAEEHFLSSVGPELPAGEVRRALLDEGQNPLDEVLALPLLPLRLGLGVELSGEIGVHPAVEQPLRACV